MALPSRKEQQEGGRHGRYRLFFRDPVALHLSGRNPAGRDRARHGATSTTSRSTCMALFGRTGGTPPKDRHPSRARPTARRNWPARRAELGVPLQPQQPAHWPTNAAPSSYAFIAAQKAGGGDLGRWSSRHPLLSGRTTSTSPTDDVIRDCLVEAGFDPGPGRSGLLAGPRPISANLEEAVAAASSARPSTSPPTTSGSGDRTGSAISAHDRQAWHERAADRTRPRADRWPAARWGTGRAASWRCIAPSRIPVPGAG
jgi:hypothetical protein